MERLPAFLRNKWEKDVAKYANNHQDSYPGFSNFAAMIIGFSRMKNHPNVLASGVLTEEEQKKGRTQKLKPLIPPSDTQEKKVLKVMWDSIPLRLIHQSLTRSTVPCTIPKATILSTVMRSKRSPLKRKPNGYQRPVCASDAWRTSISPRNAMRTSSAIGVAADAI